MRKLVTLVIVILAFAFGLTVLVAVGMFLSGFLMMDGNFGGIGMMMGSGMLAAMLWPTVLIAIAAAPIIVGYDLLVPKISPRRISEAAPVDYRDAVLRLLKDDERSLIEALTRSGGTAFQRDLQHAIGFSKVKTHRVIARLAERRLVEVTPVGKTNRIHMPAWLVGDAKHPEVPEAENSKTL
ncbi:MAG: helix-turn-helix transcriptional regulator [Candidatus Bathyarchaeia archaeon]